MWAWCQWWWAWSGLPVVWWVRARLWWAWACLFVAVPDLGGQGEGGGVVGVCLGKLSAGMPDSVEATAWVERANKPAQATAVRPRWSADGTRSIADSGSPPRFGTKVVGQRRSGGRPPSHFSGTMSSVHQRVDSWSAS